VELRQAWVTDLRGKLSSPVVADGRVLVAEVDAHTVHALDEGTGRGMWAFTAGGRVDSPPTVYRGRVYFGSADGWVYCLRGWDGQLMWRFRAAPRDQRLLAFEQLESVWPVHGSVLVQDDVVACVAGRSNFLDGGLRLVRLDAATGEKLSETVIDERDPTSGENLQARVQVLNMPVGLPDILSSDGRYLYMRSQVFDTQGRRMDLGPYSGQPAQQGAVQRGETVHLFAPMGFLDDTWFHRSYWVYGRSFAGGHGGYYQAGRFTPSGRILVFDDDRVYGFGRKPQYYRWTTPLEHQLFASPKDLPDIDPAALRRGRTADMVTFRNTAALDPTGKPVTVELWTRVQRPGRGVLLARGGPQHGFAMYVQDGKPHFAIRVDQKLTTVSASRNITGRWVHLVGRVTPDRQLQLFVDGELAASVQAGSLLTADPAEAMQLGADDGGAAGAYNSPFAITALIDEVRLYYGTVTAADIERRYAEPDQELGEPAGLVLACSFGSSGARDATAFGHHGQLAGARLIEQGQSGGAVAFQTRTGAGPNALPRQWTRDVPLLARAMVLTRDALFLAGPPDLVDEEETFRRLVNRDQLAQEQLALQDAALRGAQGGSLLAVSVQDGTPLADYHLDALPVWDGLAATLNGLFLCTEAGSVVHYAPR
jgi:hypothetical protein